MSQRTATSRFWLTPFLLALAAAAALPPLAAAFGAAAFLAGAALGAAAFLAATTQTSTHARAKRKVRQSSGRIGSNRIAPAAADRRQRVESQRSDDKSRCDSSERHRSQQQQQEVASSSMQSHRWHHRSIAHTIRSSSRSPSNRNRIPDGMTAPVGMSASQVHHQSPRHA